ncbi:Peptidyl-prolyl cis-trans isomerase E [Mizuhopecten yessoensis]|uniref:Peptidyl-prolyl cis-trans isomerase E n=1 Tax=Mizuhopecten yessoensis TaxID=6573 RepID=A0A210PUS3_MIZYE|nr:Peptidyl-prolyl cis-trans isomerase E [Mizuhopecten yessoensis]
MATTNTKRIVYVGGLAEEVDEKILHAAFIPFGDITDIQIPLDYETGVVSWIELNCLYIL